MNKKIIKIFTMILILIGIMFIKNYSNASNDIIVMLDPGHGGTESGAVAEGLVEKDLNWKLATRVKEILDKTPGITGILTKEENETLSRYDRAERAKNNNADLLVSFHINSNDSSNNLSGVEVYITHNTKQKRYYEYSNILGLDILENLRNVEVPSFAFKPKTRVGTPNDVYADGTVADYYGIISWPMHHGIPAVLIEHCFINNPYDRENYLNDSMLTEMAKADAKAIIENKELFSREYYGEINTDLKTMELGVEADGRSYIKGEILIAEWIDGVAGTPKDLPEMKMKATDGSYETGFSLVHNGGLSYTYYRIIENLDKEKEYSIEVKLTSEKNLSSKKTQTVKLSEKEVGKIGDLIVKTGNNKFYFSYGGYKGDINTDLKEISLNKNESGNYYISGNMLVAEWIEGTAYIPKTLPELKLKSIDGKQTISMYISHLEGLNYYYDGFVDDLDITKQYYIEARLTSEDNTGTKKVQKVILPEKELGTINNKTLILENNQIKLTYTGDINTDLKTINLSGNNIKGEILIAEWIDSVAYEPNGKPEMTLKSTDGNDSETVNLVHNGGLNYIYNVAIDNLDTSKEYEIEVKLTGRNNTGTKKKQIAKLPNKELGKYENVKLVTEENKIKMVDQSLYVGDINTDLKTMKIGLNGGEREYIYGEILIAEWINGEACMPKGLPEMTLKSTDGEYSAGMYVAHQGGLNYYYDRVIWNLDTSKEYYIEVKLTGNKNIGTKKEQKANLNVGSEIGTFKDKNMLAKENKIVFKGNEYYGEINTDLKTMKIDFNGGGREYIYGEILIAEWINGEACIPNGLPEMTLRSTDGEYNAGMYVKHLGGLNYYYDRVIWNLDTSKEYYIEVKLTNTNNISTKKIQNANMQEDEGVGIFKETTKIVLRENKMIFEPTELQVFSLQPQPEIEEQEEIVEIPETEEIKENGKTEILENQEENIKPEEKETEEIVEVNEEKEEIEIIQQGKIEQENEVSV